MLPEVGILLDAGTGLFRMTKYLQTTELDIYLSHAHGDHTRGLVFLRASYFDNEINKSKVVVNETNLCDIETKANHLLHTTRIHATQPALDFLVKEYEPKKVDWHLLQSHEQLPCSGLLTSFSVGNQDEVGFRLDWPGHSLAYVTDTIAKTDAPYVENIRGVNVLLHECNGPNRLAQLMVNIHHSYTLAVTQVAALAQVGRLILVHKNPIVQWSIDEDLDAGRVIFPSTEIGMDWMEIEF